MTALRKRCPNTTLSILVLLLIGAAAPRAARADSPQALVPKLEGQALVEALKQGGYVILMRHMATQPVAPDDELLDLEDCATQRNLSEQGRREAEQMGAAFKKLGIRVSKVISSPYCRCVETGKLAFGQVTKSEMLSVGDSLTFQEKHEWGGDIRKLLATPPEPAGTNTVLITHTGTLLYSFGLQFKPEGIAHVFKRGVAGQADYVGMVEPEQWPALAGL